MRISEPLDHELSREYFLTILARDQGSPPLSNTAIISINITDVNDNPPRFGQDAYTASVSELAAEGTEVFKVCIVSAEVEIGLGVLLFCIRSNKCILLKSIIKLLGGG